MTVDTGDHESGNGKEDRRAASSSYWIDEEGTRHPERRREAVYVLSRNGNGSGSNRINVSGIGSITAALGALASGIAIVTWLVQPLKEDIQNLDAKVESGFAERRKDLQDLPERRLADRERDLKPIRERLVEASPASPASAA